MTCIDIVSLENLIYLKDLIHLRIHLVRPLTILILSPATTTTRQISANMLRTPEQQVIHDAVWAIPPHSDYRRLIRFVRREVPTAKWFLWWANWSYEGYPDPEELELITQVFSGHAQSHKFPKRCVSPFGVLSPYGHDSLAYPLYCQGSQTRPTDRKTYYFNPIAWNAFLRGAVIEGSPTYRHGQVLRPNFCCIATFIINTMIRPPQCYLDEARQHGLGEDATRELAKLNFNFDLDDMIDNAEPAIELFDTLVNEE